MLASPRCSGFLDTYSSSLSPLWSKALCKVFSFLDLCIMPFQLPYFRPKLFGFFGIWLLICFCIMPSHLLIEFSFVVLKCPALYCFTLCRYLFNLPSFARTFWFISSSRTVIFSRIVFCILFPHIPGSFCFTVLVCFRRFFIWVSSRISHPGFDRFLVLFKVTLIFSHTNLTPA